MVFANIQTGIKFLIFRTMTVIFVDRVLGLNIEVEN